MDNATLVTTQNDKIALKEHALKILFIDLERAEERAKIEGWIDADDLERELKE